MRAEKREALKHCGYIIHSGHILPGRLQAEAQLTHSLRELTECWLEDALNNSHVLIPETQLSPHVENGALQI